MSDRGFLADVSGTEHIEQRTEWESVTGPAFLPIDHEDMDHPGPHYFPTSSVPTPEGKRRTFGFANGYGAIVVPEAGGWFTLQVAYGGVAFTAIDGLADEAEVQESLAVIAAYPYREGQGQ